MIVEPGLAFIHWHACIFAFALFVHALHAWCIACNFAFSHVGDIIFVHACLHGHMHARSLQALSAGLKALRVLGINGVSVEVHWGLVEVSEEHFS